MGTELLEEHSVEKNERRDWRNCSVRERQIEKEMESVRKRKMKEAVLQTFQC